MPALWSATRISSDSLALEGPRLFSVGGNRKSTDEEASTNYREGASESSFHTGIKVRRLASLPASKYS